MTNTEVKVVLRPPHELFDAADGRLATAVSRTESLGIDPLCGSPPTVPRASSWFDIENAAHYLRERLDAAG